MLGEVRDDFGEGRHAAAVAMDHEERGAGAVDFGVHFEAVDVVVFAGRGVVAVGGLGVDGEGDG